MGRRRDTTPNPRFCTSILLDEPTWQAVCEMADEKCDGSISAMVRSLIRNATKQQQETKEQVS